MPEWMGGGPCPKCEGVGRPGFRALWCDCDQGAPAPPSEVWGGREFRNIEASVDDGFLSFEWAGSTWAFSVGMVFKRALLRRSIEQLINLILDKAGVTKDWVWDSMTIKRPDWGGPACLDLQDDYSEIPIGSEGYYLRVEA